MRTIRASEISTYVFCQRAWKYLDRGEVSNNISAMASGSEIHYQHGKAVLGIGCLRSLAYGMLLVALIIIVIYLTELWF
jgi:hypothetical protein